MDHQPKGTISYNASVVRSLRSHANGFTSGYKSTTTEAVAECLAKIAAGRGRGCNEIRVTKWEANGNGTLTTNMIGGSYRIGMDRARQIAEGIVFVAVPE